MSIDIANLQEFMEVPEERIRTALKQIMLEELGREVNISLAVVDDKRITELNRTFLRHRGPTDVLAFPLGEGATASEEEETFGEIVISAECARREARRRKTGMETELVLYAVHGMLHLVGYDDHSPAQRKEMRRRETEVLGGLTA